MKTCDKCETDNLDFNKSCTKCGAIFDMEVIKYLNKLKEELSHDQDAFPSHEIIFRGISRYSDTIRSSAAFQLSDSKSTLKQGDFIRYHEVLIESHKRSYPQEFELCDLIILAKIQHTSSGTCLIDFTRNFLISLWFACRKHFDENGCVFAIDLTSNYNIDKFQKITDDTITKRPIRTLLEETLNLYDNLYLNKMWVWEPMNINNKRAEQQDSIFIFGLPPIDKKCFHKIDVPAGNKKTILKELSTYFNIDEKTLFYAGFNYPIEGNCDFYFTNGLNYFNNKTYSEAYVCFEHQLEKCRICSESPKCECDKDLLKKKKVQILFLESICNKNQGHYPRAINNLNEAIEFDVHCEKTIQCQEELAYIYYALQKYKEARKWFNLLTQNVQDNIYYHLCIIEISCFLKENEIENYERERLILNLSNNNYYVKILLSYFKFIYNLICTDEYENYINELNKLIENFDIKLFKFFENENQGDEKRVLWDFSDTRKWVNTNDLSPKKKDLILDMANKLEDINEEVRIAYHLRKPF